MFLDPISFPSSVSYEPIDNEPQALRLHRER